MAKFSTPTLPASKPCPGAVVTSPRYTAWPPSSSAESTPKSMDGWTRWGVRRRWDCGAGPQSLKPSSPTNCFERLTQASAGNASRSKARGYNDRCGRPRPPRTRAIRTRCTSTTSLAPTRSTHFPKARWRRLSTTEPWPARSTPASRTLSPSWPHSQRWALTLTTSANAGSPGDRRLQRLRRPRAGHPRGQVARRFARQRALVSSATGHGEPHQVHAAFGGPRIDSVASNQLSKVGADQRADRNVCVQIVAEHSGDDVGANGGRLGPSGYGARTLRKRSVNRWSVGVGPNGRDRRSPQ